MNGEPQLITIDSNVLIHLFNPRENTDRHIEILLTYFRVQNYLACVHKVIRTEYNGIVQKWIQNRDQEGNEVILVRHWLDPDNQYPVEIDKKGVLFRLVEKIIKKQVKPKERTAPDWRRDCMFVSVACVALTKLVTNDDGHILASRQDLLDKVPQVHEEWSEEIDFLSSVEAYSLYCNP